MMLYNPTSEFLYLNSWRSFYKASSRDGLALDSEFCGVPRIFSELFGQSKGSQISLTEREHTRVYCNFLWYVFVNTPYIQGPFVLWLMPQFG